LQAEYGNHSAILRQVAWNESAVRTSDTIADFFELVMNELSSHSGERPEWSVLIEELRELLRYAFRASVCGLAYNARMRKAISERET